MAKRKAKGRYWVAFWLGFFLVIAAAVVGRQKTALDTAGRLRALRESRGVLEATKAELERRIRVSSTAEALSPKVARSGLHLPPDTASTILVVGRDRSPR